MTINMEAAYLESASGFQNPSNLLAQIIGFICCRRLKLTIPQIMDPTVNLNR